MLILDLYKMKSFIHWIKREREGRKGGRKDKSCVRGGEREKNGKQRKRKQK